MRSETGAGASAVRDPACHGNGARSGYKTDRQSRFIAGGENKHTCDGQAQRRWAPVRSCYLVYREIALSRSSVS